MQKILLKGKEARKKIKEGVDICADLVKLTLGPAGRNVLIWRQNLWPLPTDDGVTIAKKLDLVTKHRDEKPDETVNLGLLTFVNSSTRANDLAGDGTTTTIIIGQKIVQEGFRRLDEQEDNILFDSINAKQLSDEIMALGEEVCKKLDEQKQEIKDRDQLIKVAQISVKDKQLGETIGDMVWQLGKYAHINIEDTYGDKIETEIINGINFYGKAHMEYTLNDQKEIDYTGEIGVIVTNQEIKDPQDFLKRAGGDPKDIIITDLAKKVIKQCILFAPKFSNEIALQFFNWWKAGFTIIPIKIPSLTDDQLEDIAIYTGATFVNKNNGSVISRLALEDVGKVMRVNLKGDKVSLYGGGGSKENTEQRVKVLIKQLEKEDDDLFKKKLERRISAMSKGVGRIRVGAETEIRRDYLLKKIEDGVNATIGALQDGIIRGGGLPLKEISDSLPKDSILKEALKAPYEQLAKNCGIKLENFLIAEDVFDPVKVTKTAVKMACSVGSMLVMTEGTIAIKYPNLADDLQDSLRKDERYSSSLPPRDREKDDGAWLNTASEY